MTNLRGWFAELRRRKVVRDGLVYVAAVWALAQGVAQLGPSFGMPGWVTRWFVVACIIGFPFWLLFAWYYDITPQGIVREPAAAPEGAATRKNDRKLDYWLFSGMAVVIVLLATNQFVLRQDATGRANAADVAAAAELLARIPAQSVAVLPLANESSDPRQQYFSDGLSEQLISDLTQVNGLKVIGRHSSFQFRNSSDSPAQIGAILGVAHLIEGSVRQDAGRIRITINLVRARDGASVWSQSYDQPLEDVFAIQSRIGRAVVSALQVQLLDQPRLSEDRPPSGNVEAFQLMLQGRAIARHFTEADYHEGIALLRRAVALDPGYAYAWGVLSNLQMQLGLGYLQGADRQRAFDEARVAADKIASLAPNASTTHLVRGYILARLDNDQMGALTEYRRALALAPHDSVAMSFLANQYGSLGQLKQSADLYRAAIAADPLRADWYSNLSVCLMARGDMREAEQAARKAIALQPDFPGAYMNLANIDLLRGDAAAARRNADRINDPDARFVIMAFAAQIDGDAADADAALREFIARYGEHDPASVAELYAQRKQPDDMFEWLQRACALGRSTLASNLLNDPQLLRYQDDPRFAALRKQLGLPAAGELPSDAAFDTPEPG